MAKLRQKIRVEGTILPSTRIFNPKWSSTFDTPSGPSGQLPLRGSHICSVDAVPCPVRQIALANLFFSINIRLVHVEHVACSERAAVAVLAAVAAGDGPLDDFRTLFARRVFDQEGV